MKKYPYLIYTTNDSFISDEILPILSDVEQLHILCPNIVNYSSIEHENTFVYTFNEIQFNSATKKNWNTHISLCGNELFNPTLINLFDDSMELFWFPSLEQIASDIQVYIDYLIKLNLPICISFNPILQNNIDPESFRLFVKKIHIQFKNPLYLKEQELLEEELFNQNNVILKQENNLISLQPIVLGLYGDYSIENLDNFNKINTKSILKTKECSSCDYSTYCINRGLGYIISSLDYKGCIGIRLME